jgi:DNA-binding CsgD family transcriptional regulator
MQGYRLARSLALGVWTLAVFTTLANLSMPVAEWRPGLAITLLVAILLVAHGSLYWYGDSVRARVSLAGYVALQAAIVFVVGLTLSPPPVVLALYVALTVETVMLAGQRWGTMPITVGAIARFGAGAILTSDVYRGATAALLLAVTGVVAHAIGALVRRHESPPTVATPGAMDAAGPDLNADLASNVDFDRRDLARLTPREREVLQALTKGARTNEIAEQLAISERTVKAHLASIYQKLGVESRTAAVAVALRR